MSKTNNPFPQFERFDRDTAASARVNAAKPMVSMSAGGNFQFSTKLTELMKLKSGSAVVFNYDRTQDTWYIHRDDKHGIELRPGKAEGVLQFNLSALRYRITETLGDEDNTSGRMQVATEPVTLGGMDMWVLLTSSLKSARKSK